MCTAILRRSLRLFEEWMLAIRLLKGSPAAESYHRARRSWRISIKSLRKIWRSQIRSEATKEFAIGISLKHWLPWRCIVFSDHQSILPSKQRKKWELVPSRFRSTTSQIECLRISKLLSSERPTIAMGSRLRILYCTELAAFWLPPLDDTFGTQVEITSENINPRMLVVQKRTRLALRLSPNYFMLATAS